jgi:hypothetical protein
MSNLDRITAAEVTSQPKVIQLAQLSAITSAVGSSSHT